MRNARNALMRQAAFKPRMRTNLMKNHLQSDRSGQHCMVCATSLVTMPMHMHYVLVCARYAQPFGLYAHALRMKQSSDLIHTYPSATRGRWDKPHRRWTAVVCHSGIVEILAAHINDPHEVGEISCVGHTETCCDRSDPALPWKAQSFGTVVPARVVTTSPSVAGTPSSRRGTAAKSL